MCSRVLRDTKVWGCPTRSKKPTLDKGPQSPLLKMLELSNSMHPQYISFVIFQALNSSAYNGISCHGLDMSSVQSKDDESGDSENPSEETESPTTSYINHLKILIHSRNWRRLEFHRCAGVESLMWNREDLGNEVLQPTTQVDFLVLKLKRCSAGGFYDEERHRDFFVNLWTRWNVQKLSLSMDLTPEWSKEFCRHSFSVLEELHINPDCKWHRTPTTDEAARTEAVGTAANGKKNGETNDGDTIIQEVDCWEYFCRELRGNHPRLKSLEIHCRTSDKELAYLINHAIVPAIAAAEAAEAADPNCKIQVAILPIEKLFFGKPCFCDERSLLALTRVLTSSSAPRWKSLTMSRGVKLPSRAMLDAGHPLPPRPTDRRFFFEFCRSLQHATVLTSLTLGGYILDEFEMGALFESLVVASGRIEKLSLHDCAATSDEVYEKALCGGIICKDESSSSPTSGLIQNQLPHLRFLHLPREALKALLEVLKSNTSIEWITHTWRTKTHDYYLDLNRGGRRILTAEIDGSCHQDAHTSTSAISPTLWPKVLERASSDLHSGLRKDRYCGGENRKYDVVYHLLRNRILLEL